MTYIGGLYLLSSLIFRIRRGRWPMAYKFPPKDLYNLTDMGVSSSLWIYSLWLGYDVLINKTPPAPLSLLGSAAIPVGLAIVAAGFALRLSTLLVLGQHWRMGIDPNEKQTEFVARGPYKFLKHPMNLALVIVAFGQAFLTGVDARAIFIVFAATAYYLIQGVAETRYWKERQTSDRPAVPVWATARRKNNDEQSIEPKPQDQLQAAGERC
jgi:protein-S-isoprenylcysteine O-methyltransferase Ste14